MKKNFTTHGNEKVPEECSETRCCNTEEEQQTLQCNTCRRCVHLQCTLLPPYQIQRFLVFSKSYCMYVCVNCIKVPHELKKFSLKCQYETLKKKYMQEGEHTRDLQEELCNLNEKIKQRETELCKLREKQRIDKPLDMLNGKTQKKRKDQ